MLAPPPVQFVVRNGLHIAYQTVGTGPPDMVFVGGSMAMSVQWEEPATAKGLRRLSSFARLVTFDQQGMGYSDRMDLSAPPTIDDLVSDLESVIQATGISDPVLFGTHNGGAVAAVYATGHPVRQLILCNTWARLEAADDFAIGFGDHVLDRMEARYETEWGKGRISDMYASRRGDAPPGQYEIASTSHNQLAHLFRMNRTYDIRDLLPSVSAPTLVIHLDQNRTIPAAHAEYIAGAIAGARLVLIPGTDHLFMRNYGGPVIDVVEEFVTGRVTPFSDRMQTTMLFTDIVDSTLRAASMGDEQWSALLDEHNDLVHRQVVVHGGHEVKSTGDGFLVAFDDTAAAVRCRAVLHGGRGRPGAGAPRRRPRGRGLPHGKVRPVGPRRALRAASLFPGRGRPAPGVGGRTRRVRGPRRRVRGPGQGDAQGDSRQVGGLRSTSGGSPPGGGPGAGRRLTCD